MHSLQREQPADNSLQHNLAAALGDGPEFAGRKHSQPQLNRTNRHLFHRDERLLRLPDQPKPIHHRDFPGDPDQFELRGDRERGELLQQRNHELRVFNQQQGPAFKRDGPANRGPIDHAEELRVHELLAEHQFGLGFLQPDLPEYTADLPVFRQHGADDLSNPAEQRAELPELQALEQLLILHPLRDEPFEPIFERRDRDQHPGELPGRRHDAEQLRDEQDRELLVHLHLQQLPDDVAVLDLGAVPLAGLHRGDFDLLDHLDDEHVCYFAADFISLGELLRARRLDHDKHCEPRRDHQQQHYYNHLRRGLQPELPVRHEQPQLLLQQMRFALFGLLEWDQDHLHRVLFGQRYFCRGEYPLLKQRHYADLRQRVQCGVLFERVELPVM